MLPGRGVGFLMLHPGVDAMSAINGGAASFIHGIMLAEMNTVLAGRGVI